MADNSIKMQRQYLPVTPTKKHKSVYKFDIFDERNFSFPAAFRNMADIDQQQQQQNQDDFLANDADDHVAVVKEEDGSDNESAAAVESSWIVKLRGLPWSVTTQDILDFLDGVEVSGDTNGVHLITYSRNSSRPNGEAFVVCATEESYNKAFEYNKKTMGHRYIESK